MTTPRCEFCKGTIKSFPCWLKRRSHHFCSRVCSNKWRVGKSFEWKSKNCAKCGDKKYKTINNTWYCKKHIRFSNMRCGARAKEKYVPTNKELELLADEIPDMICIGCDCKMKWTMREGGRNVLTLQHDRSGRLRFICFRCNNLHRFYVGDLFYLRDRNKKYCPHCDKELPFNQFYKNRSWCKLCRSRRKRGQASE